MLFVFMKHLVLVDGHHMMYRAYWAIPRTLKTSKGEQVNTVFGMASMLISILAKEKPDALAICFDDGDQTFRHQEHAEYKEGRAETPDDFYAQIPRVFELVDALGIPQISDPEFEADDFLGAYAKQAEQEGMKATIVSGDRDVFQMASEHIRIAIPHKGYQAAEYFGPEEVKAKLGITPEQVPAYKGLAGDSSDNLPGVHGIGPKTAAQLIQDHGSLEGIYEHLADIRPSVRQKLEQDKEQAFFCQKMSVLKLDMPLPQSLEEISLHDLPVQSVFDFFAEMEFSLLTKRFQALLDSDDTSGHFSEEEKEVVQVSSAEKEPDQMAMF